MTPPVQPEFDAARMWERLVAAGMNKKIAEQVVQTHLDRYKRSQQAAPAEPEAPPTFGAKALDALVAFGQGASLGFSDELSGMLSAVGALVPGGQSPGEAYKADTENARSYMDRASARSGTIPGLGIKTTTAMDVLGQIATGSVAAAAAAPALAGTSAAFKGATLGAAIGGAQGVGRGEGGGQKAAYGALGALGGGIVGGIGGKVAGKVAPNVRKVIGNVLGKAKEASPELSVDARRQLATALANQTNTPIEDIEAAIQRTFGKPKPPTVNAKLGAAPPRAVEPPDVIGARAKYFMQQGFSQADANQMAQQGTKAPKAALEKLLGRQLTGKTVWY